MRVPVGGDFKTTRQLGPILRAALEARPGGLREPLLISLCVDERTSVIPLSRELAAGCANDSALAIRVRGSLRRLGARRDDELRWCLPGRSG